MFEYETQEEWEQYMKWELDKDADEERLAALKEMYGDDYTPECECGHYCERCVL